LILSTNAGGKVDSIPKMIPIFFTVAPSSKYETIALAGQRRPETLPWMGGTAQF
jgi:hypothetical protein